MKHFKPVSMPMPADECCDCQERKAQQAWVTDTWAKCESLGQCEGPSYVCIPMTE